MRRTLTTVTIVALLVGAPLAGLADAHDHDRRRDHGRHDHPHENDRLRGAGRCEKRDEKVKVNTRGRSEPRVDVEGTDDHGRQRRGRRFTADDLRELRIKVRWEFFNTEFDQEAEPYGLVAKANIWYLVYGRRGAPHVARVSQIVEAEMLPESFSRPPQFQLESFWQEWCREYESRPPFYARVRVAPEALPLLAEYISDRARRQLACRQIPDADGWVTLDLPFESFIAARSRLLGLGRAVEVLEPKPLRRSLVDFAEQIVDFYKNR